MHRPVDKRKQTIRLVAIYTIMPIVIVSTVALMILYMLGYRIGTDQTSVSQVGLVQFGSRPSGARVVLDGESLSGRTALRQDVPIGSHTVSIEREGYQTWQKTVMVEFAKILWLDYARLIPEKLSAEPLTQFSQIDATLAHNEPARLLIYPDSTKAEFVVISPNDKDQPDSTTVTIPASIYDSTGTFTPIEWDSDGTRVLVKSQIDETTNWLLVDTSKPENSQNVSAIVGRPVTDLLFDESDNDRLYALTDGAIKRVSIANKTVSAPLVQDVATMAQSDKGVVTYVTTVDVATSQRQVGYLTPKAVTPKVLRKFYDDGTKTLDLRVSEYQRKQYFAVVYGKTLEISGIELHASDDSRSPSAYSIATLALPEDASSIEFSPDSRFVVARQADAFTTYDLELGALTTTPLKGPIGAGAHLSWLDDRLLWSDRGGELTLYEFDGANSHSIVPAAAVGSAVLSPSGKYLYVVQDSDAGFQVARVQLIE